MTEQSSGSTTVDLLHEVRTAINHILGYSAILIDGAEELALPQAVSIFETIHADGIELLEKIQGHAAGEGATDFGALETELKPLAEHVLNQLEELALAASHREMLEDAEVVANACRRLLSLVHS